MSTIDHFNLRNFDLNLLIAFDALVQELNVTRAAERLKVQQPAMSHSLKTLRTLFDDPLFVRVGQSMQLTPRALALAGPVRLALQKAEEALLSPDVFDPGRAQHTFRIGLSSEPEVHLLPDLMALLRQQAPGISLIASHIERTTVRNLLDQGEIDVAIGCFHYDDKLLHNELLYEERLCCCYNPALFSFSGALTADDYINQPHALMSFSGTLMGCVEGAFRRVGATLNSVFAASNFLALLSLAQHSPVLVTLPERIALRYAHLFELSICPVPISLETFPSRLIWSARVAQDPAMLWLREKIIEVNQALNQL